LKSENRNKDRLESAKDIATHAIDKSSEIVENAAEVLRGDVAGGVGRIVQNSLDIATHSVAKAKEMVTGKRDDAEQDDAEQDAEQ
jgi:hypothetical protein